MTTPHRFVEYQVSPIGKLAIRLVKQWRLRALMLTLAFLSLNTYGMGTITSIELAPTATVCDSDTGSPLSCTEPANVAL
jgi:hypothetical protein